MVGRERGDLADTVKGHDGEKKIADEYLHATSLTNREPRGSRAPARQAVSHTLDLNISLPVKHFFQLVSIVIISLHVDSVLVAAV